VGMRSSRLPEEQHSSRGREIPERLEGCEGEQWFSS